MEDVELRSATTLSDDELAALFTAAYEGYVRPMQVTADALRFLTKAYDLDRGASRVASGAASPSASSTSACAAPTRGSAGSASCPPRAARASAAC